MALGWQRVPGKAAVLEKAASALIWPRAGARGGIGQAA